MTPDTTASTIAASNPRGPNVHRSAAVSLCISVSEPVLWTAGTQDPIPPKAPQHATHSRRLRVALPIRRRRTARPDWLPPKDQRCGQLTRHKANQPGAAVTYATEQQHLMLSSRL